MSEHPRRILGLVADLFGALSPPLTVVAAIVIVAFALGEKPTLEVGFLGVLICVFIVGSILLGIGLWIRWRYGSVFHEDRGKSATILMSLGVGCMLLSAITYLLLS